MTFRTIIEQGYFLNFNQEIDSESKFRHEFCGQHSISGAYCPNCKKTLLRVLDIDFNDERLTFLSNQKHINLLYCWTCNVAQDQFYYQILNPQTIKILFFGEGGAVTDFPYEDYPLFFQSRFPNLEIISKEEQTLLSKMNQGWPGISEIRKINNKLIRPQHQIGGEPQLPQGELDELICPMCKKFMPFLAMIGNDCGHPQGLCGNDYVAVIYYYCNKCLVVGVVLQCD